MTGGRRGVVKQKIGSQNVLYPTPVAVVGALVNGKANFCNISHNGILNAAEPHFIMLSMSKHHHTNLGIREHKTFSVNIVSAADVVRADYVGIATGSRTDKSSVFETFYGELKTAPLIRDCPLSMECRLYDTYEIKTHEIFIGQVVATYADDAVLTDGEVDLEKVKPLLFDMTSRKYWTVGPAAGVCWSAGKQFQKT
jgi:flavin reductase (DIM6/NTAB) family NADH-FMN oxidoreductase RutF